MRRPALKHYGTGERRDLHGLDLSDPRGAVRSRLRRAVEANARLHPAAANGPRRRLRLVSASCCSPSPPADPGRNGLRGMVGIGGAARRRSAFSSITSLPPLSGCSSWRSDCLDHRIEIRHTMIDEAQPDRRNRRQLSSKISPRPADRPLDAAHRDGRRYESVHRALRLALRRAVLRRLRQIIGYPKRAIDDSSCSNGVGKTVPDISRNAIANLGYADIAS